MKSFKPKLNEILASIPLELLLDDRDGFNNITSEEAGILIYFMSRLSPKKITFINAEFKFIGLSMAILFASLQASSLEFIKCRMDKNKPLDNYFDILFADSYL